MVNCYTVGSSQFGHLSPGVGSTLVTGKNVGRAGIGGITVGPDDQHVTADIHGVTKSVIRCAIGSGQFCDLTVEQRVHGDGVNGTGSVDDELQVCKWRVCNLEVCREFFASSVGDVQGIVTQHDGTGLPAARSGSAEGEGLPVSGEAWDKIGIESENKSQGGWQMLDIGNWGSGERQAVFNTIYPVDVPFTDAFAPAVGSRVRISAQVWGKHLGVTVSGQSNSKIPIIPMGGEPCRGKDHIEPLGAVWGAVARVVPVRSLPS